MSRVPSRAPSNAPSQAPSHAPSQAPSQSPQWLALTSAPPRPSFSKAPTMATIAETSSSANPATIVPASRGLPSKTSARHAPSRALGSSYSRAGRTHAPSQAAATSSRYPGSTASGGGGVPTLSEAPSAAPSAVPTLRGTQSIAPDADDMPVPTTVVPAGITAFQKSVLTNRGQDIALDEPDGAPTMIPTDSGMPIASKYTSQADIAAATRQANYSTLGEEERRKQDKWAKQKADEFAPCPMNFMWERHPTRESLFLSLFVIPMEQNSTCG
ncbi:hypothetical protein PG996_014921 [Apiospora saccharicola]|uniref:Uncharacterized protein n=1 Tax=Apiospora saccharicola TaxID=335842 RepID=A0ABR1TJS6_9PEZI